MLHVAPDLAERAHRARHHHGVEYEGGHLAAGHLALQHGGAGDPEHEAHAAEDQQDHDRGQQRAGADAPESRAERRLHVLAEALAAALLLAEGLHRADAAERLLQVAADIAHAVLRHARVAPHAPAEHDDGDHHRGHHQHHEAGERRARHHQHRARAEEEQQVAQRRRRLLADHGLQQGGVGGDAREQLAHLVDLEEGRAQPHQAAEDRAPDVRHHPLAEPGDEVEAREGAARQQRHHARHVDQRLVEPRDLLAAEAVVDQDPEPLAQREHRCGADAERKDRRHDHPAIGAEEAEQLADVADLAARRERRRRCRVAPAPAARALPEDAHRRTTPLRRRAA